MNIAQCVYLHFRCWTFGVFPLFGYCEEHISTVSGPSPWPGPAAVREPAVHMGVPPSRGKTMGRRVPAQQPRHEVQLWDQCLWLLLTFSLWALEGRGRELLRTEVPTPPRSSGTTLQWWPRQAGRDILTICFCIGGQKPNFEGY